ncbi:MAG: exodeoxyribonuclease VII small subunit [Cyanobacteria bacterium P01_E01_bin.42]
MTNKSEWNYEEAVVEVEAIAARIESGALPLEAVFDQFEVAIEQLRQCEMFLNQGKERMDLLIETLEDEPTF